MHGYFQNMQDLRADALAAWGHDDDEREQCDDATPWELAADMARGW